MYFLRKIIDKKRDFLIDLKLILTIYADQCVNVFYYFEDAPHASVSMIFFLTKPFHTVQF